MSTFAELLSHRSFVRYWWCRVGTQLAAQMTMVALGWQMYELTGSAWDLGLVGLAQFVPALVLTLPAGHLADRVDRARIFLATIVGQGAVAAVLTAATHGGWIGRELILGLSVLLGVARAFQMPATQSLAPQLVPTSVLPRALAASMAGTQLAIVSGPALGGLIYGLNATAVYGVSAACLLVAALLAAGVHPLHGTPPQPSAGWRSVLAGVSFIWQRPVLLGSLSLDLFAVLLGGATALLPIFAKDILHTGPWGLGLLRAAPAAGALLVSLWLTRHPLQTGVGSKLFAAVAVFGLSTLLFGLSTSFTLSLVALLVSGGADMVSVVIRQTLVQLDTPDEMRGRVAAVNSVFIGASNQLGEFESGATAAWLGPVGSVVLGGAGTLVVCALWVRWFPLLWRRDHLAASEVD